MSREPGFQCLPLPSTLVWSLAALWTSILQVQAVVNKLWMEITPVDKCYENERTSMEAFLLRAEKTSQWEELKYCISTVMLKSKLQGYTEQYALAGTETSCC